MTTGTVTCSLMFDAYENYYFTAFEDRNYVYKINLRDTYFILPLRPSHRLFVPSFSDIYAYVGQGDYCLFFIDMSMKQKRVTIFSF